MANFPGDVPERVQSERPRGQKAARRENAEKAEAAGGLGGGNVIGQPATDTLSVENGYGGQKNTLEIGGKVYTMAPFTFFHLEEAGNHIAVAPIIILGVALERAEGKPEDADIDKLTAIVRHLNPDREFTPDSVRIALAQLTYITSPQQRAAIVKIIQWSLFRFQEADFDKAEKENDGPLSTEKLLKWLDIPRVIDFFRKMFRVNLGVYDRFLLGFEGSPPPDAAQPDLEELRLLMAEMRAGGGNQDTGPEELEANKPDDPEADDSETAD